MVNNYCLYNIISPSGKTYIGVTNSFTRRMREHYSDWKNRKENIALHNSFTKYGYDNHTKEIIIFNLSKETAYKLEELSVKDCNTTNSKIGLNSRSGGRGGNYIDWQSEKGKILMNNKVLKLKQNYDNIWNKRLSLILMHKDTSTISQIANMLGCGTSSLCNYLSKNNIKIKRKSKYNLFNIANEIKEYYIKGHTNQYVINKTGYSKGTICRAINKLKQIDK